MNLSEEIKKRKNRKHFKKIVYSSFGILIILISWTYYFNEKDDTQLLSAQELHTVQKGNLEIYVSWEWNIISGKKVELNFPLSWIISGIFKKEWDTIKIWEKVAKLDDILHKLERDKASIALRNAYAQLSQKKEVVTGSYEEVLEKNLELAKQLYENTKLKLSNQMDNERNAYETLRIQEQNIQKNIDIEKSNLILITNDKNKKITNLQNLLELKWDIVLLDIANYLNKVDELIWVTELNKDKNNSFENYLWSKDTAKKNLLINDFTTLYNSFLINKDSQNAETYISLAQKTKELLELTSSVILSSSTASTLSATDITNYKTSFETYLSTFELSYQNLILAKNDLEYEKVNKQTSIEKQNNVLTSLGWDLELINKNLTNAWSNISNLETINQQSLIIAKKELEKVQLEYENSISAPTDIELSSYYIEIENAKNNLKETEKRLADTTLLSPVEWTILDIHYKVWEHYGSKQLPFWIVISTDGKYIESYVEERDIVKISEGQKVNISLEAIENYSFTGRVVYVSNKWEEDNDEIIKYKTLISFEEENTQIRDSMSTSLDFLSNTLEDVIIIPSEYIVYSNWTSQVLMQNGTLRSIQEWFSDGNTTEVLSGLEAGEVIGKKE